MYNRVVRYDVVARAPDSGKRSRKEGAQKVQQRKRSNLPTFTFIVRLIHASQGEHSSGPAHVDVPHEEREYWYVYHARLE